MSKGILYITEIGENRISLKRKRHASINIQLIDYKFGSLRISCSLASTTSICENDYD